MKIAQFLCFSPDFSKEQITVVHVLPELPPCNRQRRWRRCLVGIIFPIHIKPQKNGCTSNSSTSRRSGQLCNRKPATFGSETSPVRKSDSDDDRGSDEVIISSSSSSSPKTPSSSSLSFPIFPAPKSNKAVEVAAERRSTLCLLVVSLMVMVFCGRICAILWMASGLCFLPRRKPAIEMQKFRGVDKPVAAVNLRLRRFCEDDRKRVVLQGFLGRSKQV